MAGFDQIMRDEMDMSQGTPGPWRHKHGSILARDKTSRSDNAIVHVAKVGAFGDRELLPFNRKRWTADAELIARAPDLLAENERLQTENTRLETKLKIATDALDHIVMRGRSPEAWVIADDALTQISVTD